MDKKLQDIQKLIKEGRIRSAVETLKGFISEENLYGLQESVENASRDYEMMLQFMAGGFKDPKRKELLENIMRKLLNVVSNADILTSRAEYHFFTTIEKRIASADLSAEAVRQKLEDYVAEQAMAVIEPTVDIVKLNDEHHQFMSMLFVYLCCSKIWTETESKDYASLCILPTIDSRDQQLLVSAITLGCMKFYDRQKLLALTDIYLKSQDYDVRQRALAGWVLVLVEHDPKDDALEQRVREMCLDSLTVDSIVQMQMEMLFCGNAEKDQNVINNEIVPGILKGSNYRITSHGIVEMENDELDEILHPEKLDLRLEDTQQYFDRMQKMQKEGSDVYFSGFSQMKRFAFFYNLSNWFVPFYDEHPELVRALKGKESLPVMMKIVENIPLCNSDRYSFLLGISSVIEQLPKDIAEAMRMGELKDIPAYEGINRRSRLQYLQDLYRYVKLFPEKKMFDAEIFGSTFCSASDILKSVMADKAGEIMKAMMRGGFTEQLDNMILEFMGTELKELEFLLIAARRSVEKKNYQSAFLTYIVAEVTSGGKTGIIKSTAKAALLAGYYKDAVKRYQIVLKKDPDSLKNQLNLYYAQVLNGDAKDVIDDLFRLEFEAFESGDDKLSMNARRTLALALFCSERHDEAVARYQKICETDASTLADQHNLGMFLWMSGKAKDAIPVLLSYIHDAAKLENMDEAGFIDQMYDEDKRMLKIYNADFTEDDLRMLCEILLAKV